MSKLAVVKCIPEKNFESSKEILNNFEKHNWVYLSPPKDQSKIPTSSILPEGEGIIISSGGSIGGPNLCFQSIKNLTNSALATGKWLKNNGLNPNECIILISLPLHHISGFMPWWSNASQLPCCQPAGWPDKLTQPGWLCQPAGPAAQDGRPGRPAGPGRLGAGQTSRAPDGRRRVRTGGFASRKNQ